MADMPRGDELVGREWLLAEIDAWFKEPEGGRSFVLAAPAGWGKTTVATHLAALPDLVDYAHFCTIREPETLEPLRFVELLVASLVSHVPAFAEAIGLDLETSIKVGRAEAGSEMTGVKIERMVLDGPSARAAFGTSVLRPIAELAGAGRLARPITILVDGLDEALAPRDETLLDVLREGWGRDAHGLPQALRLIAFTRNLPEITDAFEARVIAGTGDSPEQIEDVRAFVRHELGDRAPVDDIVQASEGSFLLARLLIDELQRGRSPDEVLRGPRGLSEYLHDGLAGLARDTDHWRSESQPVLGAIAIAGGRGLDKAELADVTGVSALALDDALRRLARFLISSDGIYRIAHPALADAFLRDREFSTYTPQLRERFREHPELSYLIAPIEWTLRDRVEWVHDTPARRDYLNRKPVAVMLARRLRRIAAEEQDRGARSGGSFLVHLDGAWGMGKSSILNFLREELEDGEPHWMVVEFNAWQQSRVGPAWWSLLAALRRTRGERLDARGRWRLRLAEAFRRARLTGAPYALTVVLVVALAAALVLAVGPDDVFSGDPEQIAKGVTAVLTAVATLWAGALVASRFMLWDSVAGARLFESSNRNPMAYLREHFGWLVAGAGRPVVFFVDDLDRCDYAYVVELLDGIQTIVRDAGGADVDGPYFVIAADGEWIRASYLHQHEAMASALREPGQTLGDLFLDKIFQLTVTMPSLSTTRQADYFKRLLASGPADGSAHREERDRVASRIRRSLTQAEVHDAWRSASPDVREAVASLAVDKLTERAVEAETEHELEKFASLLDRNPRRIKRFLNTYTADLVTFGLEDNFLDPDALAIWTILRMRWPTLAAYLREQPNAIEYAHQHSLIPDDIDPGIRRVFHFGEVRDLIDCPHGGPLTVDLVAQLTRGATLKPNGPVVPEATSGAPDVGSTGG